MSYQLVAFDMDGTLLQSDHRIDPKSLNAIDRATAAGKLVTLATGRSLSELVSFLPDLPSVRYGVLASGALLYDFHHSKVLSKKILPAQVVATIREIYAQENCFLVVMADGQCYVPEQEFQRIDDFFMTKFRQLYIDTAIHIPDMGTFLEQGEFEKINLYFTKPEARKQYVQVFNASELCLIEAEATGLEITIAGADKGTALAELCQMINVSMQKVIGVGDSDNDITMLQQVGLGLAMGNAKASIQSLAKAVLRDHDRGGCAQAIDDYLLRD